MQQLAQLRLKEKIKQLICSNNSPSEIALGVAVGVFICVLPLYGLHTALFIAFAFLIPRANKAAMFIGTNFSLPPTLPFITWAGYDMGRWVLPQDYPPLNFAYFRHFDFKHFGNFYFPLFVGSVILGVVCAIVFYGATYIAVIVFKKIKQGKVNGTGHHHPVI